MPFDQRIFVTNIYNISKWQLGSSAGGGGCVCVGGGQGGRPGGGADRVAEAIEISIQLKT